MYYKDILQYGTKFSTTLYESPEKILSELDTFSHEWKPYNPRKKPGREGLSVTSLDGGFSGVPDLDSIREYCIKHQVRLDEMSFQKPTEAAPVFSTYMEPFEGYIGRSHVIRMDGGGYFPPHRDDKKAEPTSFRLLVPLQQCNPPHMWFMLEDKPIHFEHGRAYFINTCMEHTVFACYPCMFLVLNIAVNGRTVETLLNHMEWK